MAYATVADVKLFAGAKAEDFGMAEADFDAFLGKLLEYAEAEMDGYLNHSYTAEELAANPRLAAALESVAVRLVNNYLLVNLQARTSPIVTVDQFTVSFPDRRVFTDDLKEALRPYRYQKVGLA